jgi:CBS domain-containing protein
MSIHAGEIMTRTVVTAPPTATVAQIARLMSQNGISALPICDKDGSLLGMVSEGDLIPALGQKPMARRAWWLEVLAEGTDLAPEFLDYIRLDNRTAEQFMQRSVIAATERTPIAEIADLLSRHHIKRVPILRDGKLVGIVSRADLIRAIVQAPQALTA